ncbi:SH3 domain-containing protein [Patescibacteria group bacterium]
MPADALPKKEKEGTFFHVYNRGVAEGIIFNDKGDYEAFLGYIKQYLSPPADSNSTKKTFTIRGHAFQGVPHQPKNYFGQIELVAYSFMPGHFHLLLHQITDGALEYFMRSLSTRYSIYFNKKYQRVGSLYGGSYRSIQIDGISPLLHLTRYFHLHSEGGKNSSYAEYLGTRKTPWVKPEVILKSFDKSTFKGVTGYKNFVEKYEPDKEEEDMLKEIIIEGKDVQVEKEEPVGAVVNTTAVAIEGDGLDSSPNAWVRLPELATAITLFILLFILGFGNIQAEKIKNTSSPPPSVSGTQDERPQIEEPLSEKEEIKDEEPKIILGIKIDDGSDYVNIRQGPTISSNKIGEAKEGDTFEYISLGSGWYNVKLEDGSAAYISSTYLEVVKGIEIKENIDNE